MIEPQTHLSLSSCVPFYMYNVHICLLLGTLSQPPFYHSALGRVLQGSHWRGLTVEIRVCNHAVLWMTKIWSVEQAFFELFSLWTSCKLDLSQAVPVASYSKH